MTRPAANVAFNRVANALFEHAHDVCDRIGKAHPLYEPPCRMGDLVQASDPIIHHTFDAGEGVLIAAEILHQAQHGCNSFVILQPFGCLPNHVVGRGIVKRLKERYPHANILPLDYDPDVSFAQYREQAANACDERSRWRAAHGDARRRLSWLGRKKDTELCAERRILDAFWHVLESTPLRCVSVRTVAQTAEVNRGTFYYHFKSVDALVDRAIESELLERHSIVHEVLLMTTGEIDRMPLDSMQRHIERTVLLVRQGGGEHVMNVVF